MPMIVHRRRENRKKSNYRTWLNRLFNHYKSSAKKRKIDFSISIDQFENLIFRNCYICNAQPNNVFTLKNKNKIPVVAIKYNGVDRIENNSGYTVGNVKPCCKKCNMIKSDKSNKELEEHLKKIIINNFQIKG